jgi:hypothetical protein
VLVAPQVSWIFATRAWTFVSSFVRRSSTLVAKSTQRCGAAVALEPQRFAKRSSTVWMRSRSCSSRVPR